MFVRIVKLSFEPKHIDTFLENFHKNKQAIRDFEGCQFLELYRDKNNTHVFFTYSYWKSENDLENYRQSQLFKSIWSVTKPMFNMKPEAWSVDKLESLE
ncbi:putative quinol monooxygenase [Bizionia hallyeonensis]|uniref:Quinol monooxygenase n=1 Tax=Bizionia hallyeonensis TaxID=1123757 RepID=A0ABW0C7L1_9FLAO